MKLYSETNKYKLYQGNMLDMLQVIAPNSIDSIVTDPPYELNFMGKGWDNSGIAFQKSTWEKCYEVLKPGGYLLAFGGSRTFHRIACAIEDAGFEIRDTIMWIYGSGFPKSMNIGLAIDKKNGVESAVGGVKPGHRDFVGRRTDGHMKFEGGMSGFDRPWMHDDAKREMYHYQKLPTSEDARRWEGWGTCLKPAFEPIIIARKPFKGSLVENVLEYGVGGLNIDGCRVPLEDNFEVKTTTRKARTDDNVFDDHNSGMKNETNNIASADPRGRFPANVILTYDETDYDEVCGGFPSSGGGNNGKPYNYAGKEYHNKETSMFNGDKPQAPSNYNDNGSASRYFYCAKASKKDRDGGMEVRNTHPTVKPTDLMQYLVRLVTPKGGVVLDPFNGSGSTGKATMYENMERSSDYSYIGIELTEDYLPIAKSRIEYAITDTSGGEVPTTVEKKEDSNSLNQVELW